MPGDACASREEGIKIDYPASLLFGFAGLEGICVAGLLRVVLINGLLCSEYCGEMELPD